MEKGWIRKGPKLDEVVSDMPAEGMPHSKTAIIMPVKDEAGLLIKHLELLSRQSTQDFDVIVVHSDKLDPEKMIASRRKADGKGHRLVFIKEKDGAHLGLTGAFYAGERYALENGFKIIMLADVDCMPRCMELVEKLSDAASANRKSVFLPKAIGIDTSAKVINWYGTFSREVLESCGLTYLPFFYGHDEFEFLSRIEKMGKGIERLDGIRVDHDILKALPAEEASVRGYYLLRNGAMVAFSYPGGIWLSLSQLSFLCFYEDFSAIPKKAGVLASIFSDIAMMRYSRIAWLDKAYKPDYRTLDLQDIIKTTRKSDGKPDTRIIIIGEHIGKEKIRPLLERVKGKADTRVMALRMRNPIAEAISLSAEILSSSMKHEKLVIIAKWGFASFNPFCILAKNYYISDGESAMAVHEGTPLLGRMVRMPISAISFAFLSVVYLKLSILSWLRVHSVFRRYGAV